MPGSTDRSRPESAPGDQYGAPRVTANLLARGGASLDVTQILIIKEGADDPIDGILESLSSDPAIRLIHPEPVDVETGIELIRRDDTAQVILIISREARIPSIVGAIRQQRPNIHLVALAIERMRNFWCGVSFRSSVIGSNTARINSSAS